MLHWINSGTEVISASGTVINASVKSLNKTPGMITLYRPFKQHIICTIQAFQGCHCDEWSVKDICLDITSMILLPNRWVKPILWHHSSIYHFFANKHPNVILSVDCVDSDLYHQFYSVFMLISFFFLLFLNLFFYSFILLLLLCARTK